MRPKKKIGYAGKPKSKPREGWWKHDPVSLQVHFRREKDRDVLHVIEDYGYWLSEEQQQDPALLAVALADKTGRNEPVLNFIETAAQPWTDWSRKVIVDYFKRQKRKRTPIYDRTPADLLLELAESGMRSYIKGGHTPDEAMKYSAEEHHVPLGTLRSYCKGKHPAARRAKKWAGGR